MKRTRWRRFLCPEPGAWEPSFSGAQVKPQVGGLGAAAVRLRFAATQVVVSLRSVRFRPVER